ncbi:MAG TPA: hypothetical protein VF071_07520 [Candidatus Limnocylindria bacterium]
MNGSVVEFAVELVGLAQPVRVRVSERGDRARAWVSCGGRTSDGLGASAREALVAALTPLGRRLTTQVMAAPVMFGASAQLMAAGEAL